MQSGFPRLYAAASLKRERHRGHVHGVARFSAALCRGLIEAARRRPLRPASSTRFSAALCRGLIEAVLDFEGRRGPRRRFPRLYAAASLKPLSEAGGMVVVTLFSAALCRGLIEAKSGAERGEHELRGFPRLYAAASLKRPVDDDGAQIRLRFSAALCRGLIEARRWRARRRHLRRFPRLYAAASLKPARRVGQPAYRAGQVFRGFMPRPH